MEATLRRNSYLIVIFHNGQKHESLFSHCSCTRLSTYEDEICRVATKYTNLEKGSGLLGHKVGEVDGCKTQTST